MQSYIPQNPSPTLPSPRPITIPVARPSFTTFPAPPKATPALKPAQSSELSLEIQDLLPKPSLTPLAPKPAATQANPSRSELPEIKISMRDAMVMLQNDIPRAIDIIETNENAYSQGYLAGAQDLRDLLISPALTSLIRVTKQSDIQNISLKEQLPELTIPRIAEILLSIVTSIEALGTTHLNTEHDQTEGQSQAQASERINCAIEGLLAVLPKDDTLKQMMESL